MRDQLLSYLDKRRRQEECRQAYPPQDAYALCSVAADLRATATVDVNKV
jgi:acetamidase/formamidase